MHINLRFQFINNVDFFSIKLVELWTRADSFLGFNQFKSHSPCGVPRRKKMNVEKKKDLEKTAKRIAWLVLIFAMVEFLFAKSFFSNHFKVAGGLALLFALEKTAIAITLYVVAKFISWRKENFRLDLTNYTFAALILVTASIQFVVAILFALAGYTAAAGIFTASTFEATILGMVLFITSFLAMRN